jgi:dipeptidyl aminopeptidase/acylaminoacyl peptidase
VTSSIDDSGSVAQQEARMSNITRALFLFALTVGVGTEIFGQSLREPVPLDVAVSLRSHNPRSPVDLSPDGEWVAHTYGRDETVRRQTSMFSATGVPFAEGNARMQAALTNTKSGQVIRLGGDKGSSWGAVWSPDGQRVAFYSDDSGEASLWIWDKATRTAERFPGVTVRPLFGFELVRWSADSQRLLCKILPVGRSAAEANALVPDRETPRRFSVTSPDEPSVFVLQANMREAKTTERSTAPSASPSNRSLADLAILDLRTRRVVNRVEQIRTMWYSWAPDQKHIAYTDYAGLEPNSEQPLYRLVVLDPGTGNRRQLVDRFRSVFGTDVNWAPDSRRIAYVANGQLGNGELHILEVTTDVPRAITAQNIPSTSDGQRPPLWSADGQSIYGVGTDGKLWHVEAASGRGTVAGDLAGHQLGILVAQPDRTTVWSNDRERTVWAIGRTRDGEEYGLYQISLETRTVRPILAEKKIYSTSFNVDAGEISGAIVFAAGDQRHPTDLWRFDTRQGSVSQVTRLNEHLDRYELGATRLIEWNSTDRQTRRGALMLPPGYQEKQRLPLVVWLYGGENGSASVNRFGLAGDSATFNMQVLATRGYAILFPDAPVREGRAVSDLRSAAMSAVDAAIDQGYADPERLAIMGQSHGAHSVLSVITQTRRFKAAVITGAVTHPDLFAAYTEMGSDGSASAAGYYEGGQGGMGGTPWQYPERYRDNSPLFSFDRIDTPLLIGQGEKDGRLISSDAVFVGLQRLGKTVEYRIYENEGHVISRKANVLDFWKRRIEFLDEYLDITRDDRGRVILQDGRARGRPRTAAK